MHLTNNQKNTQEIKGGKNTVPLLIIIIPWCIMLIIYHFGPLNFQPLLIDTWVYLLSAMLILIIGFYAGWFATKQKNRQKTIINEKTYKTMCVISFIGAAILLYSYSTIGYSLSATFFDPIENRVVQSEEKTNIFVTVSYPLSCLAYSCMIMSLLRIKRKIKDFWATIPFLSIVMCILANIMISGRQTILIVILLLISFYCSEYIINKNVYQKIFSKWRSLVIKATFILGAITYFLFIGGSRFTGEMSLEKYTENVPISNNALMKTLLGFENDKAIVSVMSGCYYYSHQLSALNTIINYWPRATGFGRDILSWPLLQLARTGLDLQVENKEIEDALRSGGENLVGWQTGFSRPINDFGIIGSLCFVFIISVLLGSLFKSVSFGTSEYIQLAAIWTLEQFIFAIQFFPTDGIHFINYLCTLVMLYCFSKGSNNLLSYKNANT